MQESVNTWEKSNCLISKLWAVDSFHLLRTDVHKLMFIKVSTVTTGELHTCHRTLGGCHRLASPWSSPHVFYEGVCMHGCERGWLSAAKCFSFCEEIDVALEIMFKNSGRGGGKVIFCAQQGCLWIHRFHIMHPLQCCCVQGVLL